MADEAQARMEFDSEAVGRRMRKWRKAAGMSQEQVATKIGTVKGNISMAEAGKQNLSLPLFLAFCRAIDAPASKVLEERLLAKNRDVDRLAGEIVEHKGGARDLEWLARLSAVEYKAAIRAARDRVDLERLRARQPAQSGKRP